MLILFAVTLIEILGWILPSKSPSAVPPSFRRVLVAYHPFRRSAYNESDSAEMKYTCWLRRAAIGSKYRTEWLSFRIALDDFTDCIHLCSTYNVVLNTNNWGVQMVQLNTDESIYAVMRVGGFAGGMESFEDEVQLWVDPEAIQHHIVLVERVSRPRN